MKLQVQLKLMANALFISDQCFGVNDYLKGRLLNNLSNKQRTCLMVAFLVQ